MQSYAEEPLSGESNVSAFTDPSESVDDGDDGEDGECEDAAADLPACINESSGGVAASISGLLEGPAAVQAQDKALTSVNLRKANEDVVEEDSDKEDEGVEEGEDDDEEEGSVEETAARVWEQVRAFAKEGKGLRAIELFQQFDKDKSGGIDPCEFAAALARVGVTRASLLPSSSSKRRVWESVNQRTRESMRPVSASVAAAVLKLADADNSGTLDFKELKHALQRPKTPARAPQATPKVDSKTFSRAMAEAGRGSSRNISTEKRINRTTASTEESFENNVDEQRQPRDVSHHDDDSSKEDGDTVRSPGQTNCRPTSEARESKSARMMPARSAKAKNTSNAGGRVTSSLVRGGDVDRSEDEDSSSSMDDFIADDDDEDEEFEDSDDEIDSCDSDQEDEEHSDGSHNDDKKKIESNKTVGRGSSKVTEAARAAASREVRARTEPEEAQQFATRMPSLAKLLSQADGPHDSDNDDDEDDDDEDDEDGDDDKNCEEEEVECDEDRDVEFENSDSMVNESAPRKRNCETPSTDAGREKAKCVAGKSPLPRSLVDAAAEDDSSDSDDDSLPTSFKGIDDLNVSRELFDTDEEDGE